MPVSATIHAGVGDDPWRVVVRTAMG